MTHLDEIKVERAKELGKEAALEDLVTGNDRSGEDVIADTEVLVMQLAGMKLHELEDEDSDLVVALVEAYDEAYIDTFMAGGQQ